MIIKWWLSCSTEQGCFISRLEDEYDGIKRVNQGFGRVCAHAFGNDGVAVGADVMVDKRKLVFEIVLAAIILCGMVLLASVWR